MSAVPGRPLPSVRVVSVPAPDAALSVVTRAPEPGRVPLGHADEARVSVHDG